MAYTPTEWKNGDVITAEKLNNLESGIQDALTNSNNNNMFFITQADDMTLESSMSYTELISVAETNRYFPICVYNFEQYFYAGSYIADAPPYIDGHKFVGFSGNFSAVVLKSIIIKSNNTVTIQNISLT